jgi:hypothetical protein
MLLGQVAAAAAAAPAAAENGRSPTDWVSCQKSIIICISKCHMCWTLPSAQRTTTNPSTTITQPAKSTVCTPLRTLKPYT